LNPPNPQAIPTLHVDLVQCQNSPGYTPSSTCIGFCLSSQTRHKSFAPTTNNNYLHPSSQHKIHSPKVVFTPMAPLMGNSGNNPTFKIPVY